MISPIGPCPARAMIIADFPGIHEEESRTPFARANLAELGRMLSSAGIMLSECFQTSALRIRPPYNDAANLIPEKKKDITSTHVAYLDRFVSPIVVDHAALLQKEIALVRPNVIIACGNTALWLLTGKWGCKHWRGSYLSTPSGIPVIPTYHPRSVFQQWPIRGVVVRDLQRAAGLMGGEGVKCPDYRIVIRPQFTEAKAHLQSILTRLAAGPATVSYDIETNPTIGHILCIAFAWSPLDSFCIPFVEASRNGAHYWTEHEEAELVWLIKEMMTHPNFRGVAQNGLYDCQYIYRAWHFKPRHAFDTMIGWHSCFSTLPKSLDFIASMVNNHYVQWKGIARNFNSNKKDE